MGLLDLFKEKRKIQEELDPNHSPIPASPQRIPLSLSVSSPSTIVFACVNKACFIFLQAMGKAVSSTFLSMIREVVFGVGFALLLPVFFGLDGVLYSMPLSDFLTFIIAAFMIRRTYRDLQRV